MADLSTPKSTTIITAAMETAGATIQSDMLDFLATSSGQTLAGLFYLMSIVSALIIFASGGNYRWGRYLLIGPTLFFFLTTIRTDSDGTEWSFGDAEYSQEAVVKALRGVDSPASGGATRVSLFYHFWNLFLSEINSELIKLLNLTESDSQFNFVKKVEKIAAANNFSFITDPQLKGLIQLTLSSKCKRYFHNLRIVNDPHSLEPVKQDAQEIVNVLKDQVIMITQDNDLSGVSNSSLHQWMKDKNLLGEAYTCQSLWEKLLPIVKTDVEDAIPKITFSYISPEEDPSKSRKTFEDAWGYYTELYSGRRTEESGNDTAKALAAIDWVIARSLYHEIWKNNPHAMRQVEGVESHYFQLGKNTYLPGQSASFNEDVAGSIKQFNITDKYAERGEFVTAALSLPYFQGLGLLILSASFPFFAILVVMPGRAVGFFTWMGLWAWLKLWDLGFAVVMLIDNMLYAMFPKGPNISDKELQNAGIAWSKMLEVDPNYSQALYYNILSTCLFAVPLATAVFVKGGGNELVNLINQGWSAHSMRIAGAAASYSRSFQAQGYMKNFQKQIFRDLVSADKQFKERNMGKINRITQISRDLEAANINKATTFNVADAQNELNSLVIGLETERRRVLQEAAYKADMTYGQYAANRAVAARYYSHDLAANRKGYYNAELQAELAKGYYDQAKIGEVLSNYTANIVFGTAKAAGAGGTN